MDEPLGAVSGPLAAPPARRWRVTGRALAGVAVLAAAIGLIALARRDYPLSGEPFAVAKVEVAPVPAPPRPEPSDASASAQEATPPLIASADQVEAASGVKVTRVGGGGPPNALIIDVPRGRPPSGSKRRPTCVSSKRRAMGSCPASAPTGRVHSTPTPGRSCPTRN